MELFFGMRVSRRGQMILYQIDERPYLPTKKKTSPKRSETYANEFTFGKQCGYIYLFLFYFIFYFLTQIQ